MFGPLPLAHHLPALQAILAQADGEPAPRDVVPEASSPLLTVGVIVACLVGPFIVGHLIAGALKLKQFATKMSLTLFALTLGLMPFGSVISDGGSWKDAIRLGIDLEGGTNMVFAVDREELERTQKELDNQTMDQMTGAIGRRINPSGTEEVTVRRVGADRIEVIVPGADPERVDTIKKAITRLGSLEFAIMADRREPLHAGVIPQGLAETGTEVTNSDGDVVAIWRTVGVNSKGESARFFPDPNNVSRTATRRGESVTEYLLVVDKNPDRRITGRLLKRATEVLDPSSGPVVQFTFNARGGLLFEQLTSKYQPKDAGEGFKNRLAVLLDNRIQSAPTINAVIGAVGTISGDFSAAELKALINVLNAGALEVPLQPEPVFESSVSPLLGIDVQEKGKRAIGIAAALVFVFMLIYYRTAGVIADICLLINIVLVLGVMALVEATFTLPGLAGLVLTIGMAVDANVLIFERIREERAKGTSLRLAINNGFGKAFSTIIDANVTTLITAVVLYIIGTDQVKGFAVTLFIGIVMSMFTSLYVGRMFFDILEKKRWIKDLSMTTLVSNTSLNFLAGRPVAVVLSLALIGVGMATFVARGGDNFDIDFRGGSMVTFSFDDGGSPTVDEARDLLGPQFESAPSLEKLSVADPVSGVESELYRLRTTQKDAAAVASQISEAFASSGFSLTRQSLTVGDVSDVVDGDAGGEDAAAGGKTASVSLANATSAKSLREALRASLLGLTNGEREYDGDDTYLTVEPTNAGDGEKATEFDVTVSAEVPDGDVTRMFDVTGDGFAANPYFEEVNTFDSAVAGETQVDAVVAMLVSLIAIVAYIWIRFQRITFGLAAVVALVHDVLVVLGMVALASFLSGNPLGATLGLSDFKINLPMIAAFLTIVGYSLNDTIVVFDRIREERGKNPALTPDMVNKSLNLTLSRTLLTSVTTFIVVFILYTLGGEGIHGFAFCLLLGVVVGTYSSIYVASPVLLWLMNRNAKKPVSSTSALEPAVA